MLPIHCPKCAEEIGVPIPKRSVCKHWGYQSINDHFAKGETKIWYQKPDRFGTMTVDVENLENTHTLLGSVAMTDLEQIYMKFQGELWSPEGEARNLMQRLGCGHTSMCMGDVIQLADGSVYRVAMTGFDKLK